MPTVHPFVGGPLDGQTFTSRYESSSIFRDADGEYLTPKIGDKYISRWNRGRPPRKDVKGVYLAQGIEYVWHDLNQWS